MPAHLTDFQKGEIVALYEEGNSLRAISRQTKIALTTVQRWCDC